MLWLMRVHDWIDRKTSRLKGWRTYITAAFFATVDFLEVTDLAPIFPPKWLPYWMVLHPLAFAYLRVLTGKKA